MGVRLLRETLDPALLERITKVWKTTEDVQGAGLDEMIACFCADPAPEREVLVWELIATMFAKYAEGKAKHEREELFAFLLDRTQNPFMGGYQTIDPVQARDMDNEMKDLWRTMGIPAPLEDES